MFFGHIDNLDLSIYPFAIQKALRFIKETNFDNLEVGCYEIEEKRIYAQVLDLETQEPNNILPEVHRNYLDIQYLHKGKEKIGVSTDLGKYPVFQEYNEVRDILFYQYVDNESLLTMRPGNFAVFFPSDIHRPAQIDEESCSIRKIVVKVAISELNK